MQITTRLLIKIPRVPPVCPVWSRVTCLNIMHNMQPLQVELDTVFFIQCFRGFRIVSAFYTEFCIVQTVIVEIWLIKKSLYLRDVRQATVESYLGAPCHVMHVTPLNILRTMIVNVYYKQPPPPYKARQYLKEIFSLSLAWTHSPSSQPTSCRDNICSFQVQHPSPNPSSPKKHQTLSHPSLPKRSTWNGIDSMIIWVIF